MQDLIKVTVTSPAMQVFVDIALRTELRQGVVVREGWQLVPGVYGGCSNAVSWCLNYA